MVDVAGGVGGLEAVARALRESRASRFYACAIEGGKGERELKAAKTRGRWERLAQSATLLRAERIECRDDDGATLAVVSLVVEDDAPEAAAAPLADPVDSAPWMSPRADEVDRLVQIVVKAQDAALVRHQDHVTSLLDAAVKLATASSERADKLERAVLTLVQHRERELAAASEALDEQARAMQREARAEARAARAAESEKDETSELDKMGEKLVNDHILPAIGGKIVAAMQPKATS